MTSSATVASYVHPGREGAFLVDLHPLPEGALLNVASLDRMETIYAPDATVPIGLNGAFSDYGVMTQGEVMTLDRQSQGRVESTYLVGAAELSFSDGSVGVAALKEALQTQCMGSLLEDPLSRHAEDPVATSVALSIEPSIISCSESWFGGLFHGGVLSRLCVGQVFEVAVTFGEAMCVWGAPQVQLRLGRLERAAQYRGRSGCDTLRFIYVVTEDDVLETSLNVADGSGGRAERLRLDIEVGELVLHQAEIHPFSGLRYRQATRADERVSSDMQATTSDYHRLLRERAGFRMKLDVNLNELEHVDELLCH